MSGGEWMILASAGAMTTRYASIISRLWASGLAPFAIPNPNKAATRESGIVFSSYCKYTKIKRLIIDFFQWQSKISSGSLGQRTPALRATQLTTTVVKMPELSCEFARKLPAILINWNENGT